MRVLQVNDCFEAGGAEMVMTQLGKALTLRGHEVHYAVGEGPPSEEIHRINHLRGIPSRLLRRLMYFNTDPLAYLHFETLMKEIKPDIVHCHNVTSRIPAGTVLGVALKQKIPVVISVHDYWPVCLNRTLIKGIEKKPKALCNETGWDRCVRDCKWATLQKGPGVRQGMLGLMKLLTKDRVKLVGVSNYTKKVLERFGYPSNSIEMIPNGIDTTFFKPTDVYRRELILFIGGMNWRLKGLNHFLTIAGKIASHNSHAKFAVLGRGLPKLGSAIESPGAIAKERLIDHYQRAICVCMPSLYMEPFPLVALESMACATPVVAYASGGLTECIENHETGFIVERNNIEEMARRVAWLLDNPDSAKLIGLRARRVVEERYTVHKMCDQYEKMYFEMVNGRRV